MPIRGLAEGDQSLAPSTGHYLTGVHRLGPGDRFVAFDPTAAVEADGTVTAIHGALVNARIATLRPASLVATRAITWLQAIPKGEKMDAIVRDATELGVTRIVPVTTRFTVVKLEGPKRVARRQRWARIAEEAARQCGRTDVPDVSPIVPWSEGLAEPEGSAFCLYERATAPLGPALEAALRGGEALTFAVGPEGGLADDEVALARERGLAIVSLGAFVLRAETVAAATLGAVRVLDGLVVGRATA